MSYARIASATFATIGISSIAVLYSNNERRNSESVFELEKRVDQESQAVFKEANTSFVNQTIPSDHTKPQVKIRSESKYDLENENTKRSLQTTTYVSLGALAVSSIIPSDSILTKTIASGLIGITWGALTYLRVCQ